MDTDNSDLLEQILRKYSKKVFSIAYYFIGNYFDAQDLSQETLIKVVISFKKGKYNPDLSVESWLYTIVHNLYLNSLRKKKKMRLFSLDESPVVGTQTKAELIQDKKDSPERALARVYQLLGKKERFYRLKNLDFLCSI